MPKADWKRNSIPKIFAANDLWKLDNIGSVLDVGCGLSLKSKYIPADIRVGVDIHDEYFKHIESKVPYVVMKYDVRNLLEIFPPKSFDVVIALDIVEHLEKKEALKMMRQMELIARKAVIIETPEGYIPQDIDITHLGGDRWQTHRSGWEVSEFHDWGYRTVLRDYRMAKTKRHSKIKVSRNITLIDAIKYL